MPQKDQKTKEYLANQVSNGLRDIMNGDKVDIEQHIEFNKSGMEKLHKMTDKHNLVKDKQKENFADQKRNISSMDEQIKILSAEKQLTLDQIAKHKQELEDLSKLLAQKKSEIDSKDEAIAKLEGQIEKVYDEMEELENLIALKDQAI
jgi:chromosome segregation ATPase